MEQYLSILLLVLLSFCSSAQKAENIALSHTADTLHSFLIRKDKPVVYTFKLAHKGARPANKLGRALLYSSEFNACLSIYLVCLPPSVSMWDKEARLNFDGIAEQYKWTFSRSPVFDHDLFVVNYLGHPYQGGYYYNTLRSQGASAWHSALFCLAQSVLWEYVWEGSVEMPSIQDMIVTPVLGSLFGELAHVATVKMSRNGFTWYERIIVCFINPPYVMNNGFRFSLSSKIPDLKH